MAQIRVHNITDRPNSPGNPFAVRIAKQQIRPGKHILVDDDLLTKKTKSLHGTAIWIGNQLPQKYRATSKSALRALRSQQSAMDPMTIEEVRSYLSQLKRPDLLELCGEMSPALAFDKEPSTRMLTVKLARILFSGSRTLNPESFFWLRRWLKKGDDFIERG